MNKTGVIKLKRLAHAGSIIIGSMAFNSHAAIIINEIDYDQPGADTAEFIELFNTGTSEISLNNYSIDLINQNSASIYRNIDLSGFSIVASGYFVICGGTGLVANCDYKFTASNSWFQNGTKDAIALYENTTLLDSLSYEGLVTPFTEGDVVIAKDNNNDIVSLARIADGIDTNNNDLDFQLGCITPGSANIAGIGNCSITQISAVPLPAAAWLFGSGIAGLIGFSRRK